ncbi:hypothetical protein COCNU_11G009490 [Cocos nucifera]|uniref:Uncharacterized protein n=1 Tax=Cocos nucifera TaxID=13894 RepID=A0A8K0IPM6_COCNU|nr:hypothetical protein COCNU_11G009490 [Cocos nucifera]
MAPSVTPSLSPEESPPPPPAQSGNAGWFSGLISGARKLVSSVLLSDSNTTTSTTSSSSSYSSEKDNCDNPNKDEDIVVSSKEYNALNHSEKNSKLVNDYLEGSLAIVSEIEPKHAIEQLLMQETFSRDECNKLTKIIQSRVVDFQSTEVGQDGVQRELLGKAASNAIDFPGSWQLSSPGSSDHQAFPPGFHDRAVMEAKKWLESKRLSPSSSHACDCRLSSLNTKMLQSDFEGGKSSPLDMARTYMQSLSSCQFPSQNNMEYKSTPARTMHPYKDETTYANFDHSLPLSKVLKRNYHTFIPGDSHEESRRVRLKSTKNVPNISKFKKVDLSAGCLEHEARKVSFAADQVSLDPSANLSPELCVEDHSSLGGLGLSNERSFEAMHPLQTGNITSKNIISDAEAAADAVASTHDTCRQTFLPSKPTYLRAGGDRKSCGPAIPIVHENKDVEEPSKAEEEPENIFVPHDSHIPVSTAMKHDGPLLCSGDRFQDVSNAGQTIIPKEEIESALRSSAGLDMELYVDRKGYVKVTNSGNESAKDEIFDKDLAISIVSVSLLAIEGLSDISPLFVIGLLEAVVAALFMNVYIVGLNQLFDIEIDKVNKPGLPLASGEYSVTTGIAIVSAFAVMIPFLRWKRFAVVAALCILAVRAVIVQLAFFLHMQTFVFRRPASISRPLIFATAFMSFFSVVIALFKLTMMISNKPYPKQICISPPIMLF